MFHLSPLNRCLWIGVYSVYSISLYLRKVNQLPWPPTSSLWCGPRKIFTIADWAKARAFTFSLSRILHQAWNTQSYFLCVADRVKTKILLCFEFFLGVAGWLHFPPYEPEKQRKPVFRERQSKRWRQKKWKHTPLDSDNFPGWFQPFRKSGYILALGFHEALLNGDYNFFLFLEQS